MLGDIGGPVVVRDFHGGGNFVLGKVADEKVKEFSCLT